MERLFEALPALRLAPFHEKLIRSGCQVALYKLGEGARSLPLGAMARLQDGKGSFFALGKVDTNPEGIPALKAIKTFVL